MKDKTPVIIILTRDAYNSRRAKYTQGWISVNRQNICSAKECMKAGILLFDLIENQTTPLQIILRIDL